MKVPIRSPAAKVGSVVYFGRMIDKIRAHAKGELPPEYQPNLGKGFDAECTAFLHIDYRKFADRLQQDGSDEELLNWCFENGRRPTEREIFVWNEFMRKRGWNDDVSETLIRRKNEGGLANRNEIMTMFAFIDADEGR